MRYGYCDSVRRAQAGYILSLESENEKLSELDKSMNDLLKNKDDQIGSMSRIMKLDTRQATILIRQNRKLRRGNFLLKAGLVGVSGLLIWGAVQD